MQWLTDCVFIPLPADGEAAGEEEGEKESKKKKKKKGEKEKEEKKPKNALVSISKHPLFFCLLGIHNVPSASHTDPSQTVSKVWSTNKRYNTQRQNGRPAVRHILARNIL